MDTAVKILPPSSAETEAARRDLRNELAKSEHQLFTEKRNADEVFVEKRKKLESLVYAEV